jgi:hypothetical protein
MARAPGCAVLANDKERHFEAVLLPSGALVGPHQSGVRWLSAEMHEERGFSRHNLERLSGVFRPRRHSAHARLHHVRGPALMPVSCTVQAGGDATLGNVAHEPAGCPIR